MTVKHVVVDGSNIATEGRAPPSLRQLDEAVQRVPRGAPRRQRHRRRRRDLRSSHRRRRARGVRRSVLDGELVTPPAGAIGRGDAFVLQIADQADATVLSNDSFQEFHGAVRLAVRRGPADRRQAGAATSAGSSCCAPRPRPAEPAVDERCQEGGQGGVVRCHKAKAARPTPRTTSKKAAPSAPATKAAATKAGGRRPAARSARAPRSAAPPAADQYAELAVAPDGAAPTVAAGPGAGRSSRERAAALHRVRRRSPRRSGSREWSSASRRTGPTSSSTAHVLSAVARRIGDPPPRRPVRCLAVGEIRSFVVQAFDTPRRGIDLALPRLRRRRGGSAAA